MKKIFLSLFFSTIFLFSTSIFNTVFAACDPDKTKIESISASPQGDYTTATSFYIVARLDPGCGTGGHRIVGSPADGGGIHGSGEFFPNYTNGDFLQDVRLTFPTTGDWEIFVTTRTPLQKLGQSRTITITSESNQKIEVACGQTRDGQLPSCSATNEPGECCTSSPVNCPSTYVPDLPGTAKWRCGGNLGPGSPCNPSNQSNPEFKCPNGYSCSPTTPGGNSYICGGVLDPQIEGRCNTEENLIYRLALCEGPGSGPTYKSTNHLRCGGEGKRGFVCEDVKMRLCLQCPSGGCVNDDSRNDYGDPANVKCESLPVSTPCKDGKCDTGLGIKFSVDNPQAFIKDLFKFALMIAGAAAILILIYAGYIYMTSAGDKTKIQGARETITSAIAGLLFLIFSITILEIIGIDIIGLPGFSR